MAGWYYVSYMIVDENTGRQVGFGAIDAEIADLPADGHEAIDLANRVTAMSYERGTFKPGQRAFVVGWSPLAQRAA